MKVQLLVLCVISSFAAFVGGQPVITAGVEEEQKGSDCPMGCPNGWMMWDTLSHCYLMPSIPMQGDTFWNQQDFCRRVESTADMLVVKNSTEYHMLSENGGRHMPGEKYPATYLWLGAYVSNDGHWLKLDGSDTEVISGFFPDPKLGDCLSGKLASLSVPEVRPCKETGVVICEMPQRPVCNEVSGKHPGIIFPLLNVETRAKL